MRQFQLTTNPTPNESARRGAFTHREYLRWSNVHRGRTSTRTRNETVAKTECAVQFSFVKYYIHAPCGQSRQRNYLVRSVQPQHQKSFATFAKSISSQNCFHPQASCSKMDFKQLLAATVVLTQGLGMLQAFCREVTNRDDHPFPNAFQLPDNVAARRPVNHAAPPAAPPTEALANNAAVAPPQQAVLQDHDALQAAQAPEEQGDNAAAAPPQVLPAIPALAHRFDVNAIGQPNVIPQPPIEQDAQNNQGAQDDRAAAAQQQRPDRAAAANARRQGRPRRRGPRFAAGLHDARTIFPSFGLYGWQIFVSVCATEGTITNNRNDYLWIPPNESLESVRSKKIRLKSKVAAENWARRNNMD